MQICHVLPGFLLGDFDNQRQLIWRFDDIREEAQGMDGKDSCLFCGVIGLQINVGIAVAVGSDIAVNGFFNHRLKRGAILHVNIVLDTPDHQIGDHRRSTQLLFSALVPASAQSDRQ